MEWANKPKKSLTPAEVLQVAHAHLICGVDQAVLTTIFATNQGRISEANTVMRWAAENHMEIYRERWGKKEKNHAKQITEAGENDEGGGAQPEIRQEDGHPAIGRH